MPVPTLINVPERTGKNGEQLTEIARKVDLLCEEMAAQKRYRLAFEDLEADLTHVAKDAFPSVVATAEKFNRKGYFRVIQQMGGIADNLVASHSSGDLEQARTSIPQLIGFLRELTRPEVLKALEAIVYGFGEVQAVEKKEVSMITLLREASSQDARRGLDILVRFLKVVGARSAKESRNEE